MSGFVVTLRDPSLLGGASATTHATKEIAMREYRDQLATMWRRPNGSLELEEDGKIVVRFPDKETP